MKFRILEYDTVSSTNDLATDFARRGAREGLVVRAEFQRRGRGQRKHRWLCPKGQGVLISILLRPRRELSRIPHLTMLTCQAARDTLEQYLDGVTLKLPNDIIVNGRKIGGVLVEGEARGNKQEWACIGLGLNIRTGKKKLNPNGTSVYIENGRKIANNEIINRFISFFSNKCQKMF